MSGRLERVTKDNVVTETYTYDDNNRTHKNGTQIATYDDQDRLLTYNGNSYTYTDNGELTRNIWGQNIPLQFALGGFSGVTMGASSFTAFETGITAASLGLLNAAYSGLFFESGALIGSLINGIPLPCDSSFRNLGNESVRNVISGTIEQFLNNLEN